MACGDPSGLIHFSISGRGDAEVLFEKGSEIVGRGEVQLLRHGGDALAFLEHQSGFSGPETVIKMLGAFIGVFSEELLCFALYCDFLYMVV